jgi:hypothetical protein
MPKFSVDVCVRIRPLGAGSGGDANGEQPETAVAVDNKALVAGDKTFIFPRMICTGVDQKLAYDAIASRMLDRLQAGFSVMLLAYGQTGSGKTHTIFGPPGSLSEAALAQSAGVFFRGASFPAR